MSQRRISPKAGWDRGGPRGPNGRRLCRRCGVEVPKGRITFCSDECVHEWRLRSDPGYVRRKVYERDHGVCALCGKDCAQYDDARRGSHGEPIRPPERSLWPGGDWQADHIVPVAEGGGECGLEGYRTLCTPCHKGETAKLMRRLAGRAKQPGSEQGELPIVRGGENP